jgi:hypothetical protein
MVPDDPGPTHAYLGASPGCWAVYGRVLAREYAEPYAPGTHRLTVDAYAAQHPGVPERRTIQSVAVHLMSLWTVFERGTDPARATHMLRHALESPERFTWLQPPAKFAKTVLDVADAPDYAPHATRVRAWARATWDAWAPHHETVRRWAGGAE